MSQFRSSLLRLFVFATGLLFAICAAIAARHGIAISSHSPLLWGATAAMTLFSAVLLLASVLVSATRYRDIAERCLAWMRSIRQSSADRLSPGAVAARSGLGLVMFGSALLSLNMTWVLTHQDPPEDDDQGAYLMTAREIHSSGGLPTLWRSLWNGSFQEANRHPLPLAILSIQPTIEFGRISACMTAALLFGGTVFLVWKRFGPLQAGIFSVLLASNGAWLFHAPRLVCECLLTGICGLAWLQLVRTSGSPWRRMLSAGCLIGLAWLTKGTGLLLLYAVLLTEAAATIWQRDLRRAGQLLLLLLGFLIVASPLLVRNTLRYGSPTYNVNSYLLWVDAYESPTEMADRMTLADARNSYLTTHTPSEMILREGSGLAWETFIGLRTLGPAPWEDARVLAGIPLFLVSILGLIAIPRRAAVALLMWTGITWIAMAWYIPIAAGDRFMMPLLIPWLTLASEGLVRWCSIHHHPTAAWRRVLWLTLLWGVGTTMTIWSQTALWAG